MSAIEDLNCARSDAIALTALFADTLGGSPQLLTDDDATRERIEVEFFALASCDADDTVVIAFSGHGSETHEQIPHDADIADLPATAVPLDLLQDWFARIPARRLIFIFDCCFSGGLGSKVLQIDVKPRDLRSAEMSRSGNVWDNAAMESFFSSLKTERTASKVYRTRDQAGADVFDYIERFCNAVRRHSTPGYLSPIEFETKAGLA